MKKLICTSAVLLAVACLLSSAALTETVNREKSVTARTATCRADCRPGHVDRKGVGMHGLYRSYSKWDPHLVSPQGKKEYAECVSRCLAPLPQVYIQKLAFAMGVTWFGKTQQDCFGCHTTRRSDRVLPAQPGVGRVPMGAGEN